MLFFDHEIGFSDELSDVFVVHEVDGFLDGGSFVDADIAFSFDEVDEFGVPGEFHQKVGDVFVQVSFFGFATSEGSGAEELFHDEVIGRDSDFFSHFSHRCLFHGFSDLDFSFGGDSFYFAGEGMSFDEEVSGVSVGRDVVNDSSCALYDFSHEYDYRRL